MARGRKSSSRSRTRGVSVRGGVVADVKRSPLVGPARAKNVTVKKTAQDLARPKVVRPPRRRETFDEVWSGAKGTNATPKRRPARKPQPRPVRPVKPKPVRPVKPRPVKPVKPLPVAAARKVGLGIVEVPKRGRTALVRDEPKELRDRRECRPRPKDNRPNPSGSGGRRRFVPWCG